MKINLKEIKLVDVNWIRLVQNRGLWQVVVKTAANFSGYIKVVELPAE
jgi:hypothetical protein